MEELEVGDLPLIIDALIQLKRKVVDTPIGDVSGYPDYAFKNAQIQRIESVLAKVQRLKAEL
ncbi:hypothetical protein [Daejeonella lutea]|uniref:Uncharacterized protein n=1 Tax=Daejeonella lutea TaxID=572036 RepID=A0A1T5AZY0_9SPHI|nr:hypothetical protein [Daejeonella lutea]SKB40516.1 hypothetical protein SAMN05661099_1166 [Daejeonella lutea]